MDSSQGAISSEFFPDGDSTSSFMRASNASSGCPPLLGGGSRMQHSFHPNTIHIPFKLTDPLPARPINRTAILTCLRGRV